MDSETVGAAEDLDVVAVSRALVVGALPSRLASDGSEVLLVESKLTGSIACEDPSSNAFWVMDSEVAGASKDAQSSRPRRVRQRQNGLARPALYLEGAERLSLLGGLFPLLG